MAYLIFVVWMKIIRISDVDRRHHCGVGDGKGRFLGMTDFGPKEGGRFLGTEIGKLHKKEREIPLLPGSSPTANHCRE